MSSPAQPAAPTNYLPDLPREAQGGVWIRLDGGEVDTTIRPARVPEHILREARGQSMESTPGGPLPPGDSSSNCVLPMRTRTAHVHRETAETKINLALHLDGTGRPDLATGVGFFDHMLTLLAKHSLIDLTVKAVGDLHVDAHHTVEDVGICFDNALARALG